MVVPRGQGDGGLEARHRLIDIKRICHGDEVPYGDGRVCSWVDSVEGLDFLHPPERRAPYFQILVHPES